MFKKSLYSDYIYVSRYAKYVEKLGRRETWPETVERYFDHMQKMLKERFNFDMTDRKELEAAVLDHKVMPSMRALMTAGKALEKSDIAAYNCFYLPVDSLKAFDEILFILMHGTGVGFSVEQDEVKKLPVMPDEFYDTETTIIFEDSRLGWAKGFREFLTLLSSGQVPKYDVSKLRPAGARLKTFGGRSSGPQPLVDLLEFCTHMFQQASGRKLSSLECHDLVCKIADIVVVGGVRRSALISLSDLSDTKMRDAKTGQWWNTQPHRALSNNSAIYNELPDMGVFMKEWLSLYESKSGERGIFNRHAIRKVVENANETRKAMNRLTNSDYRIRNIVDNFGSNPCNEIILLPYEFCNLTSVQIYEDDTLETLNEKVRIATVLGTYQSCLTNFKYINKKTQKNCEDERLLGVSLNGIFDNKLTNGSEGTSQLKTLLSGMKMTAIKTNDELAKKLGINPSVAVTAIKPEGTTSAFCGTSSGIHPAHSPYYIRYVRNDKKDPLVNFMIDNGFPFEKDVMKPDSVICFKFPIKASEDAFFKKDIDAVSHLELWKIYQQFYCEHKPSITVSVKESEWLEVGAWCYKNFDWLSGVSFLPAEEGTTVYKQAPFTECSQAEYEALLSQMPKDIDWSKLAEYEVEDTTTNAQDLACVAGGCEIQ